MSKAKRSRPFVRVTIVSCLLASLLFFTSLDSKFFDLFLRTLPSLTENEKVFVLTLDDDSINYAGGFPFRREVMGDVVVLLKELGVQTIAFDLSYLDESPPRLDREYAAGVFDHYLDSGFAHLDERSMRDEFNALLSILLRDVDDYFAQTLAFSDCSFLTLTMIRPEDLLVEADVNIATNTETEPQPSRFSGEPQPTEQSEGGSPPEGSPLDRYLANYLALHNVVDVNDSKTPEMAGVFPAIQKLLSRAKGAGTVNASPDADGLRRRVHLLLKYKDDYYPHLTLAALQEKLGYSSIKVSNNAITLIKSSGKDIRIPRAQDGSVLLKWPKKSFYDYQLMSLLELIQHTTIEPVFADNIFLMHDSGFFIYWDGGTNPWEYYSTAAELKNASLMDNTAAPAQWFQARRDFFKSCDAFLNGPYEQQILVDVGDDPDTAEFVREIFDVCREQFNRLSAIRGKATVLADSFCVIGADATSMTDNGLITFQEHYPNVGTYAVAANMILSGEFLDDAPWFIPAIIALLYSFAIAFLISRFDTYASIITGVSGLLILFGGFVLFFMASKIYIGFAVPLTATTLTFVTLMVSKFLTASREKTFLHGAFSRYLAPEVITDIINNPDKLNLGGEKREMTAIFTDIQGFSTISEKLDPTHLVKLLNRYLTTMSNIIMENLGTIDKYEGDAIIAFFGAPVFRADHPVLACRSALAMKAAERELNKVVVEEGLSPTPLFTRIGINTGEMVVGNMGAENKMDYTIMGNAVNLAARLEGVNKQYHTGGILLSEYTKEKIGDEFLIRRLDRVRVVGINTPLRLYELLELRANVDVFGFEAVNNWEQAINLYEQQQFGEASKVFQLVMKNNPNDKVAVLYNDRCIKYEKNPPPADWDAVNNLTEK